MTDDPFFARLRKDARPLRYEPDEATLARIHASIERQLVRDRQASVADLLAAWFRPLAATAAALALAAVIGTSLMNDDAPSINTGIEITSGGESWRVGD